MVFQNYALYPQKSVYKNLAFPLQMRDSPEINRRSRRAHPRYDPPPRAQAP